MPDDTRPASARTSRTRLLLWAILLVAGLLRLVRLDLMAFEIDEGAACIFAARFAETGLAPLVGVKTSLQFYNSPLFIYVISPAFLVTLDPRLAAMLFALLGTVAVYVVYRTGREFFSPAVGLLAAAMMAVAPTAVEYSRRLWGHSLIQILSPVAFYLMLRWIVGGRAKAAFWLAMIIAAAQQFHFSGALLWVQLILAYLLFRPRTDWVGFALGLVVGLIAYVPFFFQEMESGFEDFRIIAQAVLHGTGQYAGFTLQPLHYWFLAATDFGHNNLLQQELTAFLAEIPLYRATRLLAGAAWIGSLATCAVWAVRNSRAHLAGEKEAGGERLDVGTDQTKPSQPEPDGGFSPLTHAASLSPPTSRLSVLLLTWSLLPLAAFLALRVPVVPPYFLIVYPVPFLAIAWVAADGWRWLVVSGQRLVASGWRPVVGCPLSVVRCQLFIVRFAVFALLAVWAIHQIAFHVALLAKLHREGGGTGSYVSFGSQKAAMRFIANYAPGRTVLVSEEHFPPDRGIDYRYWYLLWTFEHDMNRFFPGDRDKAEYWYVIRNTKFLIKPDYERFFQQYPWRQFGKLRVYVIPRPGPWPEPPPPQVTPRARDAKSQKKS